MQYSATFNSFDARLLAAGNVDTGERRGGGSLGFLLLLVLTAVLFVRPAELIPSLEALPIYQVVLIACLAASLPAVLSQFSPASLAARPASLCVMGMLAAIMLSHLIRASFYGARIGAADFSRPLLCFLLLVGLLDSTVRLRRFLIAVAVFVFAVTVLAVLQYHDFFTLATLRTLEQRAGLDENGEVQVFLRLQATGIFSDPNDFSLALVTALIVLTHLVLEQAGWLRRLPCLLMMLALAYAFSLTRSRGGFLALVAGAGTYMVARWGWRRSVPLALVLVPLLLVAFGGRQTNINLDDTEDSTQGRLLLWRDGMQFVKSAPVFGIGYGAYADEAGHVAHNSYVHCYAELGMFGGTLFVGAWFLPLTSLRRIGRIPTQAIKPDLARWHCCVFALVVAYMIGICSLSRSYALLTYLILGVAGAYCNLVAAGLPSAVPPLVPPCSFRLACRVGAVSVGVLLAFNFVVRAFVR